MPEDNHIRARFVVRKGSVTILATFHEVSVIIRWPRTSEPDLTSRHVRTLLGNLTDVVKDGLNEVFVQDQANKLDEELRGLFEKDSE